MPGELVWRMNKFAIVAAAILLAGCSDDAPIVDSKPYRVVETTDAPGSCEVDELLLSAYCYSDKGRSISASGPALQPGEDGRIVGTCLTGGRHLRLICVAQP